MYFKKTGNKLVFVLCTLLFLSGALKSSASGFSTHKNINAQFASVEFKDVQQDNIRCNHESTPVIRESFPVYSFGYRIRQRYRHVRNNDFTPLRSSDLLTCSHLFNKDIYRVYYNFDSKHEPYYYIFLFRLTPF